MLDILRKFVRKYFTSLTYFYRVLRYRLLFRVIISILIGVLDGFGLAMFIPLLKIADGNNASSDEMGDLGFLVEAFQYMGIELNLLVILITICSFFILKGVVKYYGGVYGIILKQFFVRTVRERLSYSLSTLSYKSFIVSDAGRIQNVLSGEVARLSQAYENYFYAFQELIMVIIYMILAFLVDYQFALLITVGGVLTNFVFKIIYQATKKASTRLTLGTNMYQSLIIQYVTNFKYLKATGLVDRFNKKLVDGIYFIEKHVLRIGKLGIIVTAVREPVLILIVCAVIFTQINFFGGTISSILISLMFFYRALTSLMTMQTAYNSFLGVSGSMDNITDFEKYLSKNQEKSGTENITAFRDFIQLSNVNFFYGDTQILSDVNLKVKKNSSVAFIGESGSGKTTLVNIICGLLPVGSGSITIDGIDYNELNLSSLKEKIGYITQDPVIFNDTIFNNVTFWDEPTQENKLRYKEALNRASILDYISTLESGDETILGNNGINLSGGQKQRLSIARELYKDIDILILDEATSALDSETEKQIQENIDSLKGNFTLIIIAHRLSTIKNVDMIHILDKGQIADSGNFAYLLQSSAKFKKMTSLQDVQ